MAEYWKSTPSHYCKYCSAFVRDTPLERKNHDASIKHQNNIQKSLRQLTQGKEREERDKQRARDEVARLNGLVGGKSSPAAPGKTARGAGSKPTTSGLTSLGGGGSSGQVARRRTAAERKAHAEQLAALGVELPEELRREVTGVGGWTTVSETVVEEQPVTLAGIKSEEDGKDDVNLGLSRGVRKRKPAEGGEEEEEEEEEARRRGWGNKQKRYPGKEEEGVGEDLDALLSGVVPRKKQAKEDGEAKAEIKKEGSADVVKAVGGEDGGGGEAKEEVKKEDAGVEEDAAPAVVFKKRKVKK